MRKPAFALVLLLAAASGGALPASAAASAGDTLSVAGYLDYERVAGPQLSPDGATIVYTRQWINRMTDRWDGSLYVMDADGRHSRYLARGTSARFSPDGGRLAYLGDAEGATQLFVLDLKSGGPPTQVTRVGEAPANLRWSPDGRSIAFTMPVPRKDSWSIDMPPAPKGAVWTEAPRVIESTHYRADREGFLKETYTHLFVVAADGGTPRQLTEGNWNVGNRAYGIPDDVGLAWTPNGKEIVFDGLKDDNADRAYQESHLYAVDLKTKGVRQITRKRGPWTQPAVSNDGRSIAFTGYDWTEQTYHANELQLIGVDGTGHRKFSGDLDRDAENLFWAPDDSGVYFTADDRGRSNVLFAPRGGGALRRVTEGDHMLSLTSVARNGTAVGVRTGAQEPEDVARFRLTGGAQLQVLTRVNADILEGIRLGAVEEVMATSQGVQIQGWVVKPPDFDAQKKYPLILHIHGGPHAMYNLAFNYSFQHLAAAGYLVLYTNPRGSTGYGTGFGNAIDDSYPSVDFGDLMASVDAVVAKGYVDTARLYATGVSGGGVLSAWCTSHTDRFAAAAVRAPVINWISFAGTTDVSAWGYFRFRGRFWDDPKKWLDHSPLMHVGRVKTPTLLMTGELDLRTPMGQTEEYYQALRALNVPTAMIRFNGEYHGTGSKPSNFMRTQLYLLNWFGRWPAPTAGDTSPDAKGRG